MKKNKIKQEIIVKEHCSKCMSLLVLTISPPEFQYEGKIVGKKPDTWLTCKKCGGFTKAFYEQHENK